MIRLLYELQNRGFTLQQLWDSFVNQLPPSKKILAQDSLVQKVFSGNHAVEEDVPSFADCFVESTFVVFLEKLLLNVNSQG